MDSLLNVIIMLGKIMGVLNEKRCNTNILCNYLPYLSNNNSQKEYYLTDIIEIIKINENINIEMLNISQENSMK